MGMIFTNEQLKGMAERLATIIATWFLARAVAKGYITPEDSGVLLPGLIIFLVAAPSVVYGWWINRNKALQQAAANTTAPDGSKPIIVTDAAMAASTPESNIVSSESFKVTGPKGVVMPPPETTKSGLTSQMSRLD